MGARVDLHSHSTVASMPLFTNKYVVNGEGETVVPPVNVMRHFADTSHGLHIGDFFRQAQPGSTGEFQVEAEDT